jgi:rubrerythrin
MSVESGRKRPTQTPTSAGANRSGGTSISPLTDGQRTDTRPWACEGCGNLVVADERPRRCLSCRRGASEYRLEELYREVTILDVDP